MISNFNIRRFHGPTFTATFACFFEIIHTRTDLHSDRKPRQNKKSGPAFIRLVDNPASSVPPFFNSYYRLSMQFRSSVFQLLTLFLTFVALPAFSQETQEVLQDADLADPIDTSDILVAKGANPVLTDADLRERLSQLNSCVELRPNGVVKGYIKTYIQLKTEKARTMLGKRLTYFPLFEEKLKEYGLPTDLKYLSVVESALNPKAVSRVGATGLWQFMPSTGGEYGLRTNSAVEDRSNPVKSTDAAARHLRDLYAQFDDWALALAAYNSGQGRVKAAMKRAGSRNFWAIQRYLPLETRNYVPAFIAATYICNFFQVHGLAPYEPDMDEQLNEYIKVYEGISFRDISEATGIEYGVIKTLNPGFKRDYVPPTTDGHYVVVPHRVLPAFVRYLNSVSSARRYALENLDQYTMTEMGDGRYWNSLVNVKDADHVDNLGQKLGVCGEHLKAWNDLPGNYVYPGQSLKLFHPVFVQKHSAIRITAPGQEKPKAQPATLKPRQNGSAPNTKPSTGGSSAAVNVVEPVAPRPKQYQYHTVQRNESLEDIARQYATSVENLRKLNNLDSVKFGTRLKIREF
jgi:membrane-bound lytic murein transglycosylase D